MSGWLDPLFQALDEAAVPVEFFFRDDDAGWRDDRLFMLLDLFERYSAPVDVAVIPTELTTGLSRELRRRAETTPQLLDFHQHGWSHVNHEVEGRKCEFGPARSKDCQHRDLASGRKRMADLLECSSDIFTPPWNRCTAVTAECLAELGFKVLSRDATAASLNLSGLVETPVHVDWFAKRKRERLSYQDLGGALARMASRSGRVGIMLHHALMDEAELSLLTELLALLSAHSKASCRQMKAVHESN